MTRDESITLIATHAAQCPDSDARSEWRVRRWAMQGKWMLRATAPDGTEWVVKFCINHADRAPESCRREHLISLLGQAAGIPVVPAWVIPADGLLHHVSDLHVHAIRDHAVLMPFLGEKNAASEKELIRGYVVAAPSSAADIFTFMRWVGDEDRSLWDIMFANSSLILIDNGLCGPGRDERIRSYHPMPDMNPGRIILMCYSHKPALTEFVIKDAKVPLQALSDPGAIARIEAIADDAVREFVLAAGVEKYVSDVLNARKTLLRSEYSDWLAKAGAVVSNGT